MSEFGGLIKEARERLGLSPHRVAELIGRAPGTVKAWERGRTVPNDPFVITSLAAVLAINEPKLFNAAGLPLPGVTPTPTIEQELASIAPVRQTPVPSPAGESGLLAGRRSPDVVHGDQPSNEHEPPSVSETTEVVEKAPPPALDPDQSAGSEFFQKSVEPIRKWWSSRGERSDVESARPGRVRPEPRTIPVRPAAISTGSYMDDPEERWSYRLRAFWTAAGMAGLGILLLWSGSRAWQALGDTWEALLSGL
jgi:transcriptional regulator with XRE-family HTH domain